MARRNAPVRISYIVVAQYAGEVVSLETADEGQEDVLRDPTRYGLDADCTIYLQRISREQIAALPEEWDDRKRALEAFI